MVNTYALSFQWPIREGLLLTKFTKMTFYSSWRLHHIYQQKKKKKKKKKKERKSWTIILYDPLTEEPI